MKKTFKLWVLATLALPAILFAQDTPPIISYPVFSSQAVSAGTNTASSIITLGKISGNFGAQISVSGGGTVTLTYECSIDGNNFVGCGTIFNAFSATNGPAADGKDVAEFYPETSKYIRFRAAAATSNMTISASVAIQ